MKHYKFFGVLTLLISAGILQAQDRTAENPVTLVWQSDAVFKVPESITYDPASKILYISNIDGKPAEKDGKGFISKVSPDGKIIKLDWVSGLNAPKGSAISGGRFYLSDVDHLIEIDLVTGTIIKKIHAAGAQFLNDVAADDAGNIYVSDMSDKNSCIYRLSEGKMEKWLSGSEISNPNGLCFEAGLLYFGNSGDGKIKKIHLPTKEISAVATVGSGIDGLSPDGSGNWIVSDWSGKTSLISPGGKPRILLDTSAQNVNSADLTFIREDKLIVIPTFFDNRVIAYRLNTK